MWKAPRIWPDQTCYIIGGGPSINDVDPEILRGKRIITTNNSYQLFPFAEFCFFFDFDWFQQHKEGLARFTGIKVSIAEKTKSIPWVRSMIRGAASTLAPKNATGVLNHGVNSGHAAVNLAVHFGVSKIILIGFDMRIVEGKHNYHNQHEKKMLDNIYTETFIPNFDSLVDPLKERKVEIVNTTLGSALTFFPFLPLEECM